MNQNYMKEKNVWPLVISMAIPMTASMLVNSLYNIIDSYFVAKISEDAMTALSLVYPIQNLLIAVTVGFAIGVNAVIAYYLGAGDRKSANEAASQGMLLNTLHGLLLTIVCILGMPVFLSLFTDSEQILALGLKYSNVVFLFAIPLALGVTYEKIFQSMGHMTISMISMLAGCILNIILDPLMIFGIGFFPKMGIEGAALATGIGQTTSLVVYLIVHITKAFPVKIELHSMRLRPQIMKKMYAVGIPCTLNLALPSFMITVLNSILAGFSDAYVLVLGAYYKLQTFLYLTANGIVQGMRPICGYNYGAGEYKRVREICKVGLILISGVMVVGTVLCIVIPGQLIGLFTENAQTVAMGTKALQIISIGFIVSAVSVTVSGVFEGLGKGVESLLISVLRYVAVILPLAFVFSRFLGADGVWHAFWVTEVVTALFSMVIYRKVMKKIEK